MGVGQRNVIIQVSARMVVGKRELVFVSAITSYR